MTVGFANKVVEIPCILPKIRERYQRIVETGSQQTARTANFNNKKIKILPILRQYENPSLRSELQALFKQLPS